MRLADDWDNITARRGAASAPADDPWSQIETRRAVETAPAVSHAKTVSPWIILAAAAGVLYAINSLNRGRAL